MISLSVLALLLTLAFSGGALAVWAKPKGAQDTPATVQQLTEEMKTGKRSVEEVKASSELLEKTQAEADEYQLLLSDVPPEVAAMPCATELQDAIDVVQALEDAPLPETGTLLEAESHLEAAALAVAQKSQEYSDLLEEIASISSGGNISVAVLDTDTGLPLVQVDPNRVFAAASTIKIAAAVSMLTAIENGTWTWGRSLNGQTLERCMEVMIVESDNDCPNAWYNTVGLDSVVEVVRSVGGTGTSMVPYDFRTTAMDLALLLQAIETGDVLNQDSKAHLLGLMGRQNYRDGIPAGLGPSAKVQDKVGFLDGNLHDAGIVRTKKGDYVFVILTEYESWEAIAQISAAIYDYL